MIRLTLRTLLAYIDDTLEPDQARALGQKVAANPEAKQLIERIRKVTRRRGLHVPTPDGTGDDVSDPNTVAEYLSDNLSSDQVKELESTCLGSDVHLAEVAACHQILTLVLTEPVRVPPSANQRMYKLVEEPASDHDHKPGKALPVGGVLPRSGEQETDDPDAALLLGMKRYSASDTWGGRVGLVAAVAGVAAFLALAVWMALPHRQPEPPDMSAGTYALAPTTGPAVPEPRPAEPKREPAEGGKKEPVETLPKPIETNNKKEPADTGKKEPTEPMKEAGPGLGDPVLPPNKIRGPVGKMETPNVIVVTRSPDPGAPWTRIDGDSPAVVATDPVLALPGYKADISLDSQVNVHLWGNVPEQVAMKTMVMPARVRFYTPASGFDADFALEAGRVYLTTRRATGAKIRVRLAGETWDVALPNNMSEVMVQVHAAFVPGTLYAREGGESPRTEARLAVVRGSASFNAPARFKKFEKLAAWTEITWDSKTGTLSDPKPLTKDDRETVRIPLLEGETGKAVQRALSDAAKNLTDPKGIRPLLEARMNYAESRDNILPTMFATYAYAAIADGPDVQNLAANLYDLMADRTRIYARKAAVMAVSAWLPRDPGNTLAFHTMMTTKKLVPDDEADLVCQLLRGYSSREKNDLAAVDQLIGFLDHPNLVVRELALGNLIAFFDPEAGKKLELGGLNVAARGEPGYDKALKVWQAWADDTKRKMSEKK